MYPEKPKYSWSPVDLLSVRVMPERALAMPISMDRALDSSEVERIDIRNGVMIHQPIAATDIRPESAVRVSRAQFVAIVTDKPASPPVSTAARTSLDRLLTLVQAPPGTFGLVTPNP